MKRLVAALALSVTLAAVAGLPLLLDQGGQPNQEPASLVAIAATAPPSPTADATPPALAASPALTATTTAAGKAGGGPDWDRVSITYSSRITADQAGWVQVANPPILVECYYTIPVPGIKIDADSTYIQPGGTQKATFRVPDSFVGSVDVQVTCRDPDWKTSKQWDLGKVQVDPGAWTATMDHISTPGQLRVNAYVSMNAECVMDYDLPTNGWAGAVTKGRFHASLFANGEYGWTLGFAIHWPGTARLVMTCVDGLNRNHTLEASFDVEPDPTNTMLPAPFTLAPTAAATPEPTAAATPAPTAAATPEPSSSPAS